MEISRNLSAITCGGEILWDYFFPPFKRPPCPSIEKKIEKDVEIFRSEVDLSRRENKPWYKKHSIEFDLYNVNHISCSHTYSIMTHNILFNTNIQFWSERVFSNLKLYWFERNSKFNFDLDKSSGQNWKALILWLWIFCTILS